MNVRGPGCGVPIFAVRERANTDFLTLSEANDTADFIFNQISRLPNRGLLDNIMGQTRPFQWTRLSGAAI